MKSNSADIRRWSLTRWLSVITVIGMFIVNVAGFLDTDTGSALGCGRQWPLCNGSVVPSAWSLQTIIEFGHRAIVGFVSFLLIAVAIMAWRKYGRWLEVKIFILIAVGFVALEAFLGAMGVLFSDPPTILALHLGVSLMAFNGIFLLSVVIGQIERGDDSSTVPTALRKPMPNLRFTRWIWPTIIYTLGALYFGAYVANTGAGGAFRGWPFPTESHTAAGSAWVVDVMHRSIALGLLLLIIRITILAYQTRKERPDWLKGAIVSLVLVCMQAISGGILVATHLSTNAFLLHVSVVTCLFASLCYLGLQSLPEPSRVIYKQNTLAGSL